MGELYYWKLIMGVYIAGALLVLAPPFALLTGAFNSIYPHDLTGLTSILQDSIMLLIAHYCCIVSIFPIAIDSIMDFYEQNATISDVIHLKERAFIFFSFALDSIVYICFRHFSIIPLLYVSVSYTKTIIIVAAVFNAVYAEYQKHIVLRSDLWLIRLLAMTATTWVIAYVLSSYTLYSNSPAIFFSGYILQIIAFILGLSCFFRWLHLVMGGSCFRNFQMKISQLSMPEFSSFVFITAMILYFASVQLWNNCQQDFHWKKRRESTLVFYVVAALFFNLAILVVPGRIIRMLAVMNMKQLSLKQTFVRHVSHEIRSPLNVVRIGLDILKSELTRPNSTLKVDPSIIELLEDITSASDSSIDILNELLDYEHMDAGNFKLDSQWRSLPHLLEGKLSWVRMLAAKKKVKLSMIDSTVATEFGLMKKSTVEEDDTKTDDAVMGVFDLESNDNDVISPREEQLVETDVIDSLRPKSIDEAEKVRMLEKKSIDLALQAQKTLYMNIDTYKIDQVVRNLITNAFKFTPAEGSVEIKLGCDLFKDGNSEKVSSRIGAGAVGVFRVDVTDTGAGIAAEDQQKLFGEFTQFNKNELQAGGGSGLGLWISKRIVRMHEGYMGFYSNGVGQGATFFFELPVYSAPPASSDPPVGVQSSPAAKQTVQLLATPQTCEESVSDDAVPSIVLSPQPLNRIKSCPSSRSSINSLSDITCMEEGRFSKIYPDAACGQGDMLFVRRDGFDEVEVNSGGQNSPPGGATIVRLQQQRKALRFLVVDDSSINRRMVKMLLESESEGVLRHAVILEADDGISAVECVRNEISAGRAIDFVLMDFVMIKMHGPQAASVMRNELHYAGYIIGVTGNALPEDMQRFKDGGADRVLTKPLTKAKLMGTLQEYSAK